MHSHKSTKQEIIFRVTDLGVAAALVCTGFELISIENANTREQAFLFEFKKGIDDSVADYWRDADEDEEALFLPAQYYFEALMDLQHMLRDEDIIH